MLFTLLTNIVKLYARILRDTKLALRARTQVQSNLFASYNVRYEPCAPGTKQTINSYLCSTCPSGKFTSQEDEYECYPCEPGYFSSGDGANQCTPCNVNTFSSLPGASKCNSCPSGKSSKQGQTSCSSCGVWYAVRIFFVPRSNLFLI